LKRKKKIEKKVVTKNKNLSGGRKKFFDIFSLKQKLKGM
jgi:hypothetical protein